MNAERVTFTADGLTLVGNLAVAADGAPSRLPTSVGRTYRRFPDSSGRARSTKFEHPHHEQDPRLRIGDHLALDIPALIIDGDADIRVASP